MKNSLIFLLMILLSACQWQSEPEVIEPELMLELLKELHLADAHVETLHQSLGVRSETRDLIYDEILTNYGLDRPRFYSSYEYYLARPEQMNDIYADLIEELDSLVRLDERRRYELEDSPPLEGPK